MNITPELADLVNRFEAASVLVVGDAVLDEWLVGSSSAVAREAPVPTVAVQYREATPGGAGNTAVNIAALGGNVRLIHAAGEDALARELTSHLLRRGVSTSVVTEASRRSVSKRRVVAERHVVARFDEGDRGVLSPAADAEVAERIRVLAAQAQILVVADYGLGTCNGPAVREAVVQMGQHKPVLIDAHDLSAWRGVQPAVVTPNWEEARTLLGLGDVPGSARVSVVEQHRERLLARTGAQTVVVTLDGDGAVIVERDEITHVPARRVIQPNSAGAGDTLTAALALGLAAGGALLDCARVAVTAATVVVQRPGTATCSRADLLSDSRSQLLTAERLTEVCRDHRAAGRSIAFTNGCFDVLHAGHIACLRAAAAEADIVVVALNSDNGVRAIKGPGRPVNDLADRSAVLAALDTVDHVVAFDGVSPLALLEAIRPDVYVKGEDHDVGTLPESQAVRRLGGRVHAVPLLPDRSTSGVIAACAALGSDL